MLHFVYEAKICYRFVTLDRPDQFVHGLAVRNMWQRSGSEGFNFPPHAVFFSFEPAMLKQEIIDRAKNFNKKPQYVPVEDDYFADTTYNDAATNYLYYGNYAGHIILRITPQNFDTFKGRMYLAERTGIRGRSAIPIAGYGELEQAEAVIDLSNLPRASLSGLGTNLRVAIFSQDNLHPTYDTYTEYLLRYTKR